MESNWRYMWTNPLNWPNSPVHLQLRALDTAITSGEWVRAVLVWDKQPNNGAIPTLTPSLDKRHKQESNQRPWWITWYDNMFRFKVLMDESINPTPHKCRRVNTDQPLNGKLGQQYLLQIPQICQASKHAHQLQWNCKPRDNCKHLNWCTLPHPPNTNCQPHRTLGDWRHFNCTPPLCRLINKPAMLYA